MTQPRSLEQFLDQFLRNSIGYDHVPSVANRSTVNFPPYNILNGDNGDNEIHVALAGYSKDDVEVLEEDGMVILKTVADVDTNKDDDSSAFQYRGIAKRKFELKFALGRDRFVSNAQMADGMLVVVVSKTEAAKPKRLTIQ